MTGGATMTLLELSREDAVASAPLPTMMVDEDGSDALEEDLKVFERQSAEYKCEDAKYLVGDRVYNKQYAQLYFMRLHQLSPVILAKVKELWPGVPVRKILEVEPGVECAVVGTLYKEAKLKPSVLSEYAKDKSLQAHLQGTKFVSGDDSLVLEDEGARMQLGGSRLSPGDFVSGICVAVKGTETEGGHFEVSDVCFPGPAPQPRLEAAHAAGAGAGGAPRGEEGKFVAFVSGLNLGGEKQDSLPLQLFVDYVTGSLGGGAAEGLASRITRTVVVGNTLSSAATRAAGAEAGEGDQAKSGQGKPVSDLKAADLFLTQLASSMPVDLMPGPSDPTNISMPQQPFHRCLLPSMTRYKNVGRVTNPHQFKVDGVSFLGTSGQNIDDIMKYVDHEDRLAAIVSTIEWCHSTPTAPDTVPCFPFADKDPFVTEKECPHVVFVGNQPKLETGMVSGPQGQKIRVVALPSFAETQTCVLVNTHDLSLHPIHFKSL